MPALKNANIDYDPGPVATITLNRVERRNAITMPMLSAILSPLCYPLSLFAAYGILIAPREPLSTTRSTPQLYTD